MTIVPASGSVISTTSVCRVNVIGMTTNDTSAFDATKYPTSPAFTYYISFIKGGTELGRSYVFSPSSDGKHEFNNYTFPSSGSWTMQLKNAATGSNVDSATAVTVS